MQFKPPMLLVALKDEELKKYGIPIPAKTLYRWAQYNRHKYTFFYQIGRRIFIDVEEFYRWVKEENRKKRAVF